MKLYIPDNYKSRTEYRILRDWYELVPVSWNQLINTSNSEVNSLILVGRLLKKLKKDNINILKDWTFQEGNQLICLPSWRPVDIAQIFNLKINLQVEKNQDLIWEKNDFFELDYEIKGTLQQGIVSQTELGNLLTINYKQNKYSGLLTVTTLPLLDLNLLTKEAIIKNQFDSLLIKEKSKVEKKREENEKDNGQLFESALYILLLANADLNLKSNLGSKLEKYLYKQFNSEELTKGLNQLINRGLLNSNKKVTNKGVKYIRYNGYLSYVKEIKKKKSDQNDRC